jgi:hypothetical protein
MAHGYMCRGSALRLGAAACHTRRSRRQIEPRGRTSCTGPSLAVGESAIIGADNHLNALNNSYDRM